MLMYVERSGWRQPDLASLALLAWRARQRPTEMLSKLAPELLILDAAAAAD
jgi:hypothetical protein